MDDDPPLMAGLCVEPLKVLHHGLLPNLSTRVSTEATQAEEWGPPCRRAPPWPAGGRTAGWPPAGARCPGWPPLYPKCPGPRVYGVNLCLTCIYASPTDLVKSSEVCMLLLHLGGLGDVREAVVPLVHGAKLLHLQ